MGKILSIIIPAYNMERYLDRCLSSLLVPQDKMSLFEVLIINDGSKDNTPSIANKYVSRFPETFVLVNKENGHYGSCVNRGLELASGVFVKILDADDAFDTSVFASFLDFLSDESICNSVDLVLSDYADVTERDVVFRTHEFFTYQNPSRLSDITAEDTLQWFIHGITYRLSILKSIHYHQTEGIAYTDLEWSFIPLQKVQTLAVFNHCLYLYSVGRDGQSVSPKQHAKNLWMEEKVIESILSHYKNVVKTVPPDASGFMEKRLVAVVEHFYFLYLIQLYPFLSSTELLVKLDNLLKNDFPLIYSLTGQYRTTVARRSFYTIRNWRQGKMGRIRIQRWLYGMADRMNRSRLFSLHKVY